MKLRDKTTGQIIDTDMTPEDVWRAPSTSMAGQASTLYDYYRQKDSQTSLATQSPNLGAETTSTGISTPKTGSLGRSLGTLAGGLGNAAYQVANFISPSVTKSITNLPQETQRTLEPVEQATEALAGVGGPLTMAAFGTPRQKLAVAGGAELAPFFMGGPSAKGVEAIGGLIGPKAAKVLLGAAGKTMSPRLYGATSAFLRSAFNPEEQKILDRIGTTALSTGLGFGMGAAFEGAQAVGKKVTEGIMNQGKGMIDRLFKVRTQPLQDFERNTGYNFSEEILKRDGSAIKGMNYEQLEKYFTDKSSMANKAADEALSKIPVKLKRDDFVKIINDRIAVLSGDKRIMQEPTVNALVSIRDKIAAKPPEFELVVANQFKRDLQDAGASALQEGGAGASASQAAADISRDFMKAIEKVYPPIRDINKTTQLYWLAKDAIKDRAANEGRKWANDTLGKLLNAFPVLTGFLGYQAGAPSGRQREGALLGFGAGAGGLKQFYQSPMVQTVVANALQKGLTSSQAGIVNALNTAVGQTGGYLTGVVAPKVSRAVMSKFGIEQPMPVLGPPLPPQAQQARTPTPSEREWGAVQQ